MFGSRRAAFRSKRKALLKDNFGKPVAAGALNATPATPGPSGNRVATDTESKMAVMPWHSNSATALATHTSMSATFGAANNRCSYYAGQSWIGFEGADFGNIGLTTGRWYLVRMFDSSSRMAYCYIQGGNVGPGETLGGNPFSSFGFTSGWSIEETGSITDSDSFATTTNGGVAKSGIFTVGKTYKLSMTGSSTTSCFINMLNSGFSRTEIVSFGSTAYGACSPGQTSFYLRNSAAGTTDITAIVSQEVTAPAATCAYAYSSVNGTQGWVKDGNFNMNDTAYTYSIFELSGTKLVCAGGKATAAWGDAGVWYPAVTRKLGRTMVAGPVTVANATTYNMVGYGVGKSGSLDACSYFFLNDSLCLREGSTGPAIYTPLDFTTYYLAIRLLAAGAELYIRTATGNWKLLWRGGTNNTATLYPGISNYSAAFWCDQIKIPADLWNPPCLLADTFTRADGAIGSSEAVDSDGVSAPVRTWSGAGATISGNALCISPTLGAELIVNGGFDADTTNWSSLNSGVLSSIAGGHSGNCLKIVNGGANNGTAKQTVSGVAGMWMQISVWYKNGTTNGLIWQNGTLPNTFIISVEWAQKIMTFRSSSLDIKLGNGGDIINTYSYFDDISVKQITLSSTLALSSIGTADALIMGAAGAFTSGTQLGWALGVDDPANPQNGLFAYVDGTYVYLDILVSGAWTNKVKATTTYVAGVLPIIVRDGTYVACYYNGALQGSTVTLSAGENTATRGLYAGGFSTYASNLIADILVKPRGTANEYGSLTAYER